MDNLWITTDIDVQQLSNKELVVQINDYMPLFDDVRLLDVLMDELIARCVDWTVNEEGEVVLSAG